MSHIVHRKHAVLAALAFVPALWPSAECIAAESGNVNATLRTLGLITGEMRPGSAAATDVHAPTLELLSIDARNVQGTGVFGSMYGFMQQQWSSGPTGRAGDLMTGLIGWEGVDHRVRLQAGRLAVFAGAPRYVYLDGASATTRLPGDLRLDAYAGSGVYETFQRSFSAPVYGARLAWMPWEIGHIGVAAQNVDEAGPSGTDTVAARQTLGVDASFRAFKPLLLTGSYAHDLLGGGLQEARLDAAWRLSPHIAVHARGEIRDPLAWLPKTSIFNAFVARTDGLLGGGIDIDTPGALSLAGGYDRFLIGDDVLDGYRAFAEARLRIDAAGRYRTGLQYGRLYNGDNGYDQLRVYMTAKATSTVSFTGDVDGYRFFRAIRGETMSIRGLLGVRWAAKPGVGLGVDGQVWRNPYFENQALVMFTLILNEQLLARPVAVAAAPAKPAPAKAEAEDDEEDEKAEPAADKPATPDAKAPEAKPAPPDPAGDDEGDAPQPKLADGGKP